MVTFYSLSVWPLPKSDTFSEWVDRNYVKSRTGKLTSCILSLSSAGEWSFPSKNLTRVVSVGSSSFFSCSTILSWHCASYKNKNKGWPCAATIDVNISIGNQFAVQGWLREQSHYEVLTSPKWNSFIGLAVNFMETVNNSVDWMGANVEMVTLKYRDKTTR